MAKKITAISVYTKDGGWSTPYPIGSTVKEASATIAGILKAYTSTGSNTDGTMTQAAITQAIDNAKTTSNTASPTIAGILKAYTSTGSNTDGTMTQAAITQAIDNAKTTINTASPTVAGVTKVYTSTGSNTDGTMTQAAITQALSSIDALVTKTDNMKASFQAGVDGIYNAITAQGTTPASKSQSDVQAAIPTLANNSYNLGYAAATKKLRYPSSIKFWRNNDAASIVYPTISKGSDGVWVLDVPKNRINSAGGGTPTGYEIQWAEATLS